MTDTILLESLLAELPRARVVCLGDVMLDRFVYGRVDRVSPEAPIPVLRLLRQGKLAPTLTPHHCPPRARVPLMLATPLLRRPAIPVLAVIALAHKAFPMDTELAITEHLKTTYI